LTAPEPKLRVPQPWRRVRSGPSTDYQVIRVHEDQVADPRTGAEHPRVIIESTDWVNIIPLTRDGRVVLIRQFRFGVWANTLEIPGGMTEPGEDPAAAAARELEEETGFKPARVERLGFVHPNPALQNNRAHSFLALDCEQVHQGRQDAGEDIAVELFERSQIPELVRRGEISHALTVAAFYLEGLRQ
jgi:ADP-ribose pyrophosphatase